MPFDFLIWGEEQAANGLTATTSKGPSGYVVTGDTITTKKGLGMPVLIGLGSISDTKPQGCAIIPQFSNRNTYIYGPGSESDFANKGFADFRPFGGVKLQPGETLTGYVSTTNVNEGAVIGAALAYDNIPVMPDVSGYSKRFVEKITITSAAAVTFNSGAAALSSALTSSNFLDTSKNYVLLGLVPNIGAATFGGIMTVANLSGSWNGYYPGIPMNALSAVTFSPGGAAYFMEPLPLSGEEFDTVTVGMTATSAGAITTGLILAEV
jgi:hypothetical protein